MDNPDESLAARMRDAALERTIAGSERVDDFVLDADGVIDLRALERESGGTSIAAPAAALATIRGRLGDAGEISNLYDDSVPAPSRWRRGPLGRRNRPSTTTDPTLSPRQPEPAAKLPVAPQPAEAAEHDRPAPPAPLSTVSVTPEIDLTHLDFEVEHEHLDELDERDQSDDDSRPTQRCPKCAGTGRRDLYDRFSQIEFYSCDDCLYMWQQDHA